MNLFPERALAETIPGIPGKVVVTCKPGQSFDHIEDDSIDAIVSDPPYADNVMYGELSDFFYVWLKRTAGRVYPEFFGRDLTDKKREAVANPMRHKGRKDARALAMADYGKMMGEIFVECRRVLKPNGILTMMYQHKTQMGWAMFVTPLMDAGFEITATWPIRSEAPGSLHIRGKASANFMVLVACRIRDRDERAQRNAAWMASHIAEVVRRRLSEFHALGMSALDLELTSYGPALQALSGYWPMDGVTPETAMEIAQRVVAEWRGEHPDEDVEEPVLEAASPPLSQQLLLEI